MIEYISDKPVAAILIDMCHAGGVEYVILSPGSRNAPLIISFSGCRLFKCLSIADERSAAYFALGLARTVQKPVVIVCTSGTAALNYAPAVAEAYYQKVPLIVITADRPARMTGQADGQAIRQHGIYRNFIRFECTLPEIGDSDALLHTRRLLTEAFIKATGKVPGPVHINIPFREPLYNKIEYKPQIVQAVVHLYETSHLPDDNIELMLEEMNSCSRIMVLVGAIDYPNPQLIAALLTMARKNAVVIVETASNMRNPYFFENTDQIMSAIYEGEYPQFSPDLLITFDVPVLSRMIKTLLRNNRPQHHWHFTNSTEVVDTYDSLTRMITGHPHHTLSMLAEKMTATDDTFCNRWIKKKWLAKKGHDNFIATLKWSDLKVFDMLSNAVKKSLIIYLANSTPVRYAQLFDWRNRIQWFANRGTSGIDGCISTAAGAAFGTSKQVLLITGDLSFFYDSNGLWHHYLPSSFRIIVINNGGGGIFRYIQGPAETNELKQFFETQQTANCKGIAQTFGFQYFACSDESSLTTRLETFFRKSEKPKLLEIFTPSVENGTVLKDYFNCLKYQMFF